MNNYEVEISEKRREGLAKRSKKTFLGLPVKQEFDGEDFCILGVPYDTSTTNRPGARFGPRAIREFSNTPAFPKYNQDSDCDLSNLKGMDYGDSPVMLGYTMESLQLIYESTAKILKADVAPIILGGDHLITYAELRAYAEKYGKVAMIHFDSHNDTTDSDVKFNHGTPFRRAIEDGFLDPTHSIQVGIRGYMETYRNEYAKEQGMKVITARELHVMGIDAAAKIIKEQVGDAPCIVTFDIDFLDPAAAPGTGTPVVGGFTSAYGMELIRKAITGLDVKGFDLVEVMEDYDPGHITALTAAHLIVQFLCVLANNKRSNDNGTK